jgi:hypothetical protein
LDPGSRAHGFTACCPTSRSAKCISWAQTKLAQLPLNFIQLASKHRFRFLYVRRDEHVVFGRYRIYMLSPELRDRSAM